MGWLSAMASGVTYDSCAVLPSWQLAQVHQEFIVYDKTQIYPEYAITITR